MGLGKYSALYFSSLEQLLHMVQTAESSRHMNFKEELTADLCVDLLFNGTQAILYRTQYRRRQGTREAERRPAGQLPGVRETEGEDSFWVF